MKNNYLKPKITSVDLMSKELLLAGINYLPNGENEDAGAKIMDKFSDEDVE